MTSFIGIGDNGETGVFMHEGILAGKILSPRPWDAPVHFQWRANLNGLESPYQQLHVLKTADEAREWTRRLLALVAIYEGTTRSEAAKIDGVTLQIVRDWVVKFNARGAEGLIDRKAPE